MIDMNEEQLKELKIVQNIVDSKDYNFSREQNSLIISFGNYIMHNFDSGVLEKLFDDDIHTAALFFDLIVQFCLTEKLSIYGVIESMVRMDFELFNYMIVKILRDRGLSNTELIVGNFYKIDSILNVSIENKINLTVQSSPAVTLETLSFKVEKRIIEIQDHAREVTMVNNSKFYQKVLDNSYDEIKKRVIDKIDNTHLPLSQVKLRHKDVVVEIEHQKEIFKDVFTNKKILSKIKQGNHFLDYLKKDDLEITDDYKIVFKGHTKALSIGNTDKAILLSIDKDSAIRELQTKIKHLKDFKSPESEVLIKYTNHLIDFIKQKRYATHVPFKALAKEVGITKEQAKNYAKKLLNINDKSFVKNFEDIKLLDK